MPTKRNDYIDLLKGFLIILVVLGHVILTFSNEDLHRLDIKIIYSFHMFLFIAISGFLVTYTKQKIDFKWLKKRFIRLMIPFFIWTLIVNLVIKHEYSIESYFKFLIKPSYWFLVVLFMCDCFTLLLEYIKPKFKKDISILYYIVTSIVLIIISYLTTSIHGVSEIEKMTAIYIPYYFIGSYIGKNYEKIGNKLEKYNKHSIEIIIIVLYILSMSLYTLQDNTAFVELFSFTGLPYTVLALTCTFYNHVIVALLGSISFIIIVDYIKNIKAFSFIKRIGKYTLAIYVIHLYCIIPLTNNNTIDALLYFVLGILIPIALYKICEKCSILKLLLFGEKGNKNIKEKRMNKKNICFLIYNMSRSGGSERVTSLIASQLADKNYNVTILSICGDNTCFYNLSDKVKLATLYNKETVNHKIKYLNIVNKIYRFYKANDIDISIEVFASLSLYVLPIKHRLNLKNISWEHYNFLNNEGMNKIARKIACKKSDQIITLTNEDKDNYESNIKKIKSKIDYIYNPTPYLNAIKSNLKSNNVITVGRLSYLKGYDRLLNAWKLVEEKNKNWKLLIYGDGEDKEKLKEQAKELELKQVKFMGKTNEIDKCYQNASIFVSTSYAEGLPMCMIEAQSFGLPIVSFNYKTGPSEIIEDNVNGYIVEDGNIEKLAERILELMNNRDRIISFSKNINNSDKFNIETITKKWINTIEEL